MKYLFTILIGLLLLNTSSIKASCGGVGAYIKPKGNEITQNPVFLIHFSNKNIYHLLDSMQFYIAKENGERVPLVISQKNVSYKYEYQVLLKGNQNLKMGESVSLEIDGLDTLNTDFFSFKSDIERKHWKVVFQNDTIKPAFTSDIKAYFDIHPKPQSNISSFIGGYSIEGAFSFNENHYSNYYINSNPRDTIKHQSILAKVTNGNGKEYIISVTDSKFSLYNGYCGGTFRIKEDTTYSFTVQLMDFSGNVSKDSKTFTLETKYPNLQQAVIPSVHFTDSVFSGNQLLEVDKYQQQIVCFCIPNNADKYKLKKERITVKQYDNNSVLRLVYHYSYGVKTGIWKRYDEEGKLMPDEYQETFLVFNEIEKGDFEFNTEFSLELANSSENNKTNVIVEINNKVADTLVVNNKLNYSFLPNRNYNLYFIKDGYETYSVHFDTRVPVLKKYNTFYSKVRLTLDNKLPEAKRRGYGYPVSYNLRKDVFEFNFFFSQGFNYLHSKYCYY